jgi:glycosyltransferase involved in cell wall biosynthesis
VRVLVFTHHYPSARRPTRASYSVSTYTALARHCEVSVLAPVPWWDRMRHLTDILHTPHETTTGIEARFPTLWSVPGLPQVHAGALAASVWPAMQAEQAKRPFDVLLAAWAYPDTVAAALLARRLRVPMVTTVLGSDINDSPSLTGLRAQIVWGLRRAQRVIAVSQALADAVARLGVSAAQIVVQHNGVDGQRFTIRARQEVRARLDLPADRKIVLFVGNLERSKGVDFLVEAAPALRREHPEALLVILGGGQEEQVLRARSKELGLQGFVHFAGRRLHADIPDWMAACDVFCLPSRREGCPNVILEALASGRPVVAARVGGVPELIRPETGIMVDPESPPALARGLAVALGRVWEPASLRASVPALSWDDVGHRYFDLLCEVVRQARRGAAAA